IFSENEKKYEIFLIPQLLFLLLFAIFQTSIPTFLMIFSLALQAGYNLALFRQFYSTTINNGIMTGNTKNLMENLYDAIFKKDEEARKDTRNIFFAICIFLLGVGAGTLLVILNETLNLWFSFFVVLIAFIWLVVVRKY